MSRIVEQSAASNHNLLGHRIDGGRLEFVSVLGVGAYGVVYLARDLTSFDSQSPQLYAVKALNKIGLDSRQRSFQRRELALHSIASAHPSVVTLHSIIESPSCIFVILDYCPDGDLFGMITENQRYLGKDDAIKRVFTQIIEAVQFCHGLGISHRDLKPENILCKQGGNEVLLADFGLATAEASSCDFGCGSSFYMSPECHGGLFHKLGCYSTAHNDIWSLGVVLVNLTCGRNPWKQASPSDETFRTYLSNPDFLRSILPISTPLNTLLKRIFCLDPLTRISLDDLKFEILKIHSFGLTTDELKNASRASREAARAWREDVPLNPASSITIGFPLRKSVVTRHLKVLGQPPEKTRSRPRAHDSGRGQDVCGQLKRCDRGFSSFSTSTADKDSSNDESQANMEPQIYAVQEGSFVGRLKSTLYGLHIDRRKDDSSGERPFNHSKTKSSKHPTGFPMKFFPRSNRSNGNGSPSRRAFIKARNFNLSNIHSPIDLQSRPSPAFAPRWRLPRGIVSLQRKEETGFIPSLPATPRSSVSPQSMTFRFINGPGRFLSSLANQEFPSTTMKHRRSKHLVGDSSEHSTLPSPSRERRNECRTLLFAFPVELDLKSKLESSLYHAQLAQDRRTSPNL